MKSSLYRTPRRGVALLLPLLAAACTDSTPLAPTPEAELPEALTALNCSVDVASGAMTCATIENGGAGQNVLASRIFGSQNRNVRLSNTNSSYDAGTLIFQTDVSVQNLTPQALGTPDGSTATGVMVFLMSDPTTIGPGTVTVDNPTGVTFVTAPNQSYFTWNEILQPNEISSPMTWRFNVPTASTAFSFTVLIRADQPDETMDFTDKVWTGAVSTDWSAAGNWQGGVVPDSASSVLVPAASLLAVGASMPALTASVQVTHLNVGVGSTLTLNSNTLTAWGNVDALGTITGGTLWMRGSGVYLGGNLPSLVINGGTTLQRSGKTSGAVSISDGSLVVDGSKPLSISIP